MEHHQMYSASRNWNAIFNVNDSNFNFKFIVAGGLEVHALFDAYHMLKLIKSSWADKQIFKHIDYDSLFSGNVLLLYIICKMILD